jgi:mono/diheme cytochrome c family protein
MLPRCSVGVLSAAGLALVSLLALGSAAGCRVGPGPVGPPVMERSAELVARGRQLFLGSCAHCHGADATGDEGPDLHGLEVSDRYLARVITRGIPHEMPSFAKKHGTADITALTAYLRSLK